MNNEEKKSPAGQVFSDMFNVSESNISNKYQSKSFVVGKYRFFNVSIVIAGITIWFALVAGLRSNGIKALIFFIFILIDVLIITFVSNRKKEQALREIKMIELLESINSKNK